MNALRVVLDALRVVRYALLVGREEFARELTLTTWLTSWLVRVLAQAIFFSMVGQLIGSAERVHYLVIGNAVIAGLAGVALTVPQSTWDRSDGTYPLLVAAPSGLLLSIMGRTSVRLANGIVTSLLAFVVLGWLFQVLMPLPQAVLLVPLVVVTLTSTWFVMLLVGSLANFAPQARNFMHNVATMTMMAFCGVNVPMTFWPDWVQGIASCLPLTHGLQAIRLVLGDGEPLAVLQSAGFAVVVGLGWLLIAILTVDRMASAGRANGSIEFV